MYNKIFKTDKFEFNIDDVLEIARKAGKEVLNIYNKDFEVEYKDDKSPLTMADKISHNIIIKGLKKYNLPVLSEEGKDIPYEERKNWEYFWMIDPLDGTKEFIKKNGEFTINIALIHKNEPVFGVVYAPVLDWIYFNDNENAYKIEKDKLIKLPIKRNDDKFIIVASRSHLNDETKKFIKSLTIDYRLSTIDYDFISIGSSLKLCLVAEGKADIYPRLAPTMEWDTAAADAVVRKTGAKVYQLPINDYRLLVYNKENLLNPWFVIQ
ncbi:MULTISPECIES: 3'(2'),5'-bisphosphate nucleotidase CysQ [unclassified Lebetimonas]|uniref:3'(2'),5'-bisphosphate nucleotidase CysQ n=1 Tax=unclassified Lebetimonas TaxID=2648158 RepID=UPI000464B603|nr:MULTISPECIES: 3'(2'),5'-bisphosphate nucleotidase CysQ [unclassified Lebetimonas]